MEEYVSKVDVWLKLLLLWSLGVELIFLGFLSFYGLGCIGGICGMRKGGLVLKLIEFCDFGY